jgi:hypothetical protein
MCGRTSVCITTYSDEKVGRHGTILSVREHPQDLLFSFVPDLFCEFLSSTTQGTGKFSETSRSHNPSRKACFQTLEGTLLFHSFPRMLTLASASFHILMINQHILRPLTTFLLPLRSDAFFRCRSSAFSTQTGASLFTLRSSPPTVVRRLSNMSSCGERWNREYVL